MKQYFTLISPNNPTILGVLGCGCSTATTAVAEIIQFSSISQVYIILSSMYINYQAEKYTMILNYAVCTLGGKYNILIWDKDILYLNVIIWRGYIYIFYFLLLYSKAHNSFPVKFTIIKNLILCDY